MKRIIAVAIYEAYVPDDVDIDEIRAKVQEEIEKNYDSFRISEITTESDEAKEMEPFFNIDDVIVGEEARLIVGGIHKVMYKC